MNICNQKDCWLTIEVFRGDTNHGVVKHEHYKQQGTRTMA